jgi:hypothetical protein
MDRKPAAQPSRRNGDDYDDEALLVATLGTRIENMDEYESNVLRDAELSSTPRLMMPSHASANVDGDNDDVLLGFPPLQALTPSRNVHFDLPHVQAVLQQIRRRDNKTDKDYLKEQMLLSLLHAVTGDTDLAVRPQQEARQEQERKRLYRMQNTTTSADQNYTTKKSNNNPTPALSSALKSATTSSTNNNNDNMLEEDEPSRRLEQIKQGQKVVRFAENVTAAQVLSPSAVFLRSKRRKSMQERRGLSGDAQDEKSQNKNSSNKSADRLTPEELQALQQRKERLKKLRDEREQRRKQQESKIQRRPKAKKRRLTAKRSRRDDTSDEEEFEFTGNEDHKQTAAKSIPKKNGESQRKPSNNATEDNQQQLDESEQQHNDVVCPLCQRSVSVPPDSNQEDVDAALAQHMDSCQTTGRASRRRRTSTPPVATGGSGKSNYAESKNDESDLEEDDDDGSLQGADAMDSEDDESLQIDDDGMEENRSRGAMKRKRPSRGSTSMPVREAVDDWDELDYEDRVADWIEHGLENMKNMKERDTDETPPGQHVYEGGLVVPAWINDRLFPYQRTGLQWMWELHCQGIGGILGDEMGLVR